MRFLRVTTAAVLLAIWLPATSQCLLEQAFLIQKDDCCPNPETPTPNEPGSACCSLAAGNYKIDHADVILAVPIREAETPAPEFAVLPSPSTADEALFCQRSWQFLERAALPIRAPSFAS